MKMKLFRYGYLIRHAFDLGRIFPIIIKQREVSKFLAGISSHIVDATRYIWVYLLKIDQLFGSFVNGLLQATGIQLESGVVRFFQPEVFIQYFSG